MSTAEEKLRLAMATLEVIAESEAADFLRENAESVYGLDPEEAIEMAYENLQLQAKACLHGLRKEAP